MEALFEKLIANTEPKSGCYILVNERSTRIRQKFNPAIELDKIKKYEIDLVSLETYYSFPIIDATNNNFKYSPDDVETWFSIEIPEGCYEITDIADYIQRIMKESGHYDVAIYEPYLTHWPNSNTLKVVLEVREQRRTRLIFRKRTRLERF